MKKKAVKKQTASKQSKKASSIGYIHIVSITFVLAIIVLVGTLTVKAITKPTVLGTNIGPLLTDQGGDNQNGVMQGPPRSEGQDGQQMPPLSGQPPMHQSVEGPQGHFEMQSDGNQQEINAQTGGRHFEMKQEDNGTIHGSGQEENGSLNLPNKGEMVEIGSSAGEFSLKSGDVEAKTHFPLSINPTTNQLTITTPAGTKTVSVLPNQAVQNLLQKQILSSITQTSSSGAAANTITLTQVNNQPAFAVPGVTDKKFLGIFPASYDKTVYVSAQNGSVLQTQESFFNKILEALSF